MPRNPYLDRFSTCEGSHHRSLRTISLSPLTFMPCPLTVMSEPCFPFFCLHAAGGLMRKNKKSVALANLCVCYANAGNVFAFAYQMHSAFAYQNRTEGRLLGASQASPMSCSEDWHLPSNHLASTSERKHMLLPFNTLACSRE